MAAKRKTIRTVADAEAKDGINPNDPNPALTKAIRNKGPRERFTDEWKKHVVETHKALDFNHGQTASYFGVAAQSASKILEEGGIESTRGRRKGGGKSSDDGISEGLFTAILSLVPAKELGNLDISHLKKLYSMGKLSKDTLTRLPQEKLIEIMLGAE